jgi:putative toxin-antitoxin system antitoxin component (TIGR02293 family)
MDIEQKLDKEICTLISGPAGKRSTVPANGKLTYDKFLADKMMIISVINRGVPYSLFDLIKDVSPFSDGDWAAILNMSTKSLHRYKQDRKSFKPIHSEKIIEIAEVTNIGKEVFGTLEKFKLWLDTPNFALGGLRPIELLRDSYGKEMVIGELTRINHGILV